MKFYIDSTYIGDVDWSTDLSNNINLTFQQWNDEFVGTTLSFFISKMKRRRFILSKTPITISLDKSIVFEDSIITCVDSTRRYMSFRFGLMRVINDNKLLKEKKRDFKI